MLTRRQFLYLTGAGAAGWIGGSPAGWLMPRAVSAGERFVPDVEFDLTAVPDEVPIFPGDTTSVWRYRGKVLKGPADALTTIAGSYLGPTFRVRRGQKVRINFSNAIPADTIVHWHGLHVPATMDGHPRFVIPQGRRFTYEFTVHNRAGTYWYHPHPHGRTGHQVYGGLAGLFLVSDPEEQAAGLPTGALEVPLVIQDRVFDRDNQLVYLSGGMMDRMNGFMGNTILVNGRPEFTFSAATRIYRLRVLNGSNARIYRLAWSDDTPLTVIGTDGGLLGAPLNRSSLMLGPGERVDLWADLSRYAVGSELELLSLPVEDGGGFGMMGRGMMGRRRRGNGDRFTVMRVSVDRLEAEDRRLPQRLSSLEPPSVGTAVNRDRPRRFHLAMGHMTGTINGRTFQMEAVAPDEIVGMGTSELWEFTNGGGGMGMMDMPHPMHLHGLQFWVVGRRGGAADRVVDEGLKDTVVVMPGERITLLVRFERYPGMFLYHCHNLEHEDMGMMRNYYVSADGAGDTGGKTA